MLMKKLILLFLTLFISNSVFSQNPLTVNISGIKENDSILLIVQKSNEEKIQKWAKYDASGISKIEFSLDQGKWALIIDATGYTFPTATYVNIPGVNQASLMLTPLLSKNFNYTWEDDDSYAGHATQVYVNEPSKLVVLNDTIKVPNDYSSVKLRNEFGIVLSNDKSYWSDEDSYRLYETFNSILLSHFGEGQTVDFGTGKNVKAIFYLTTNEQYKDITIEERNGIKYITISQAAFTYADPQIVTLDGIKGKYFSKRLYNAIVNYLTDFGSNNAVVDQIAMNHFGIRFMKPDQETQNLMGEDASDFQEFFPEEKIDILSMFEEMPDGFHKIDGLKYLVRRINGQVNPKYPSAPAIAWKNSNTIEFMSLAFNQTQIDYVRRLILHEKTHFLWAYTFDDQTKNDWATLGGWFIDPTSPSGWSTYNTTEFVSAYGHQKNPDEDMAESVADYITNPGILMSRSMRKYEFIRDRIMHGTRYKAQIREDLTFTVYNLFPDYIYPGKIIGDSILVNGAPEENKEVTIKFKLHSINPATDGASVGYIRMVSTIGTIHDIWLYPQNGSIDSILVGKTTFSKHEKSGYWNICSLSITDPLGNTRYENTSTIGFKLYFENPLEDIVPPKWENNLSMVEVEDYFSQNLNTVKDSVNGIKMEAIKYNYSLWDKSPINRSITRIFYPSLDSSKTQRYEEQIQARPVIDSVKNFSNGYNSEKHFEMYLPIPEYSPSGYYAVSMINSLDIANNISWVYFVNDTSNFHIAKGNLSKYKDVRDSIYIKTLYPDYIAPDVDVNQIHIEAQPTNPVAPNGETRVDISLLVRDRSDYPGHESGVRRIRYSLKDPLGVIHHYDSWNDNGLFNYYSLIPEGNNNWKQVNLNVLLPKGSPPGKWGLLSLQTADRAGNFRNYSFVEYVRFDVIPSDIILTKPLQAHILNKYVNANSVDSIQISLSCEPSAGLNYIYTIYSLMGGNVIRGEGKMSADSLTISNIDLSGVLDGIIKLTVQITDSSDQLIATTTTEYTKDVVRPKAYYLQTNLKNYGLSNLDSLALNIALENVDIGGTYKLVLSEMKDSTMQIINQKNLYPATSKLNSSDTSIVLFDTIHGADISLKNLDIESLEDGLLKSTLVLTDQNANIGDPQVSYFYKSEDEIQFLGSTINYDSIQASPTDIYVSKINVDENQPSGTIIARLSCKDFPANDTHTYSLVSGDGDTDNGSFTISGDTILSKDVFDFETKSTYSVRIQIVDGNGGAFSKSFIITVNDENDPPTDIIISDSTVDENSEIGTVVGMLSSVDQDTSDTHSYIFVSGDGDTDNGSFTISGDTILSKDVFDFETKSTYSVRILTDDGYGGTYSKRFTITVKSTLGVNKYFNKNVKIYPNPVNNNSFNIETPFNHSIQLHLMDIYGRLILSKELLQNNNQIKLNNISGGIYIIQLIDNNRIIHQQKIVMKN